MLQECHKTISIKCVPVYKLPTFDEKNTNHTKIQNSIKLVQIYKLPIFEINQLRMFSKMVQESKAANYLIEDILQIYQIEE